MNHILVNGNGEGNAVKNFHSISLSGSNSIIGRSIVIHSIQDDFVTQPSGNSGSKIASCVIGIVEKLPSPIQCSSNNLNFVKSSCSKNTFPYFLIFIFLILFFK